MFNNRHVVTCHPHQRCVRQKYVVFTKIFLLFSVNDKNNRVTKFTGI